MQKEAQKGLDWREEHDRGGTRVGVARANQIVAGGDLTPETWKRVRSYFARHEVDKEAEGWSPGEDGYPSAGRIAWALWGGDPGKSRANSIVEKMEAADDRVFGVDGEKAGRSLSKANEDRLKECLDDVKEAYGMDGLTRACKALLKSAVDGLEKVLESTVSDEPEEADTDPVAKAVEIIIAEVSAGRQSELVKMLSDIKERNTRKHRNEQFRRKFGKIVDGRR